MHPVSRQAGVDWPEPGFPHITGYDFRIQEGAEDIDLRFGER